VEEPRARLEKEVTETIRRLRHAGLAVSGHVVEGTGRAAADLFEAAQETEITDGRLGEGARLVRRLQLLRAALDRLERGGYGICVECEEPIPHARLRVVPEAATCVPCQERRERKAA
jgi:RNA polymerase-binding transcription factor DksA